MSTEHTKNWPDLAVGLYDRLTGNNAEITYAFEKLNIEIPSGTGSDAEHAKWVLDGKLVISTRNTDSSPK
jgi:hypothetical protein